MTIRVMFFFCGLVLLLTLLFALCAGHVWHTPIDILNSLFNHNKTSVNIITLWRLPRVITAMLIGILLGISGTIFQGVFRNPLAEPWLIGSSGGAAVGATLALLLPWSLAFEIVLPLFSFIGALSAALLVLSLARIAGYFDVTSLLLSGIAVSAILTAIRSFLMMILSDETISLQVVMSWLMGGVQTPEFHTLIILIMFSFLLFLLTHIFLSTPLDLLGLGDNMAQSYGLNVKSTLIIGILLGSATAALAVSIGGIIAFIGLAAPHIGRLIIGTRHRYLLPISAIMGAIMVTLADALSRCLLPPGEIPLGLLTAITGGPFFLFLIAKKTKQV